MTFDGIENAFKRNAPGKYEAFFSAVVDSLACDVSSTFKFDLICRYVKAAQKGMSDCETLVHMEDNEDD